jgi:hypothetical protein
MEGIDGAFGQEKMANCARLSIERAGVLLHSTDEYLFFAAKIMCGFSSPHVLYSIHCHFM